MVAIIYAFVISISSFVLLILSYDTLTDACVDDLFLTMIFLS